jgi:hypothetical protein
VDRPRYARDLIWADNEPTRTTLAMATESMSPLPGPPENELSNQVALETIRQNPHLFKIVTPIDVDQFESLLDTHPNRSLIRSISRGLREGFWPWADTSDPSLPETWDNSFRLIDDPAKIQFVHEQRDKEIALDRFSPPFGPDLLPAMYAVPIGVVPKPHSTKLRLVVDHSAEPHSLNGMIPKDSVTVPLDNLHDLGSRLRTARRLHGQHTRFHVFKSDVSQAYRRIPLHPLWQIRQVLRIGDRFHVDRCNNFGNRGAGGLWGSFIGLVTWAAIHIEGINDLLTYVDDCFSWDFADNLLYYEPYDTFYPAKQTRLLQLWDSIGLPHEKEKQVFGETLTIIGLEVDPNAMTITMPAQARSDLITAIRAFARPGQRRPLREFQQLGGWINWALNAFPLLRPGLSLLYSKMAGKQVALQPIWVSVSLCRELSWLADHLQSSDGIRMLESDEWGSDDADITLYTDASLVGMSFWSPFFSEGFQSPLTNVDHYGIFFYEALAVLSALDWAANNDLASPHRVAIFSDNSNTVDMFNSLRAQPYLNPILLTAVDILRSRAVELRVYHIPGEQNVVADALSRFRNDFATTCEPSLHISMFQPPRLTLGATQK